MKSSDNRVNRGGGFLLGTPTESFTPEKLSEEQQMVFRSSEEFVDREVWTRVEEMEGHNYEVTRSLLMRAGEMGLVGADIPMEFGGLGLDVVSSALIAESMGRGASFATTFGAHAGIGTLPIVYFGTEEQKKRFLPSLATADRVASYALTESDAGSDARNIQTRADLSSDEVNYVLNGTKQWITNSGFADLFIVYAKVDGDKMTAFIVERDFEGVSIGPEADKMGLNGTSTCEVILRDVKVPVENTLGEIGRGHVIAFNILNIGRFKLGAICVGASKKVLSQTASYAKERRQFGKSISEFAAVKQKLAKMASKIFVMESMVYRTAALAAEQLKEAEGKDASSIGRAIQEYAIESSICKIFGSETMDSAADEALQIHGGYGYMKEFGIERAYRDARISRIFEGTNEINRLLIPATLMRRSLSGELPLMEAIGILTQEITSFSLPSSGDVNPGPLDQAERDLDGVRKAALLVMGTAAQKYVANPDDIPQELLMDIADLVSTVFSIESALLRTKMILKDQGESAALNSLDCLTFYCEEAVPDSERKTRRCIAALSESDDLQIQISVVRRFFRRNPVSIIGVGRRIADRVLEKEVYSAI